MFLALSTSSVPKLFLTGYEQFESKTEQLAVVNVRNRVNLQVNIRFYRINFWRGVMTDNQGRISLYPGGADAPYQKLGEGFLGPWGGELIILT